MKGHEPRLHLYMVMCQSVGESKNEAWPTEC